MSKPVRELMSHSREIYCRFFKDRVIYEIPCVFGEETALGRGIQLEILLNPRDKVYTHDRLREPLVLSTVASKENYKTNIQIKEQSLKFESHPGVNLRLE